MNDVFQILACFGGVSMVIWTAAKVKLMQKRAELDIYRQQNAPPQNDAVAAEVRALKQQMNEMNSAANGFNIALDSAVSNLEARVNRMETKQAATGATLDETQTLGRR